MPKSAVSRILQNLFVKVVKKSAIEIISGKWGHWFYENWEKVGQWSLVSGYIQYICDNAKFSSFVITLVLKLWHPCQARESI